MKNLQIFCVSLMMSFCLTLTGISQSLYNGIGHIPPESQVDWTNAGLLNQITVADHILYITDYITGNDNEKINDAMDDAQNLGGITIIYFPPGNYVFDQTVELRDSIIIQGADQNQPISFSTMVNVKTVFLFKASVNNTLECVDI